MAKQNYQTHWDGTRYEENVAKLREFVRDNRKREGREFYNRLSYESRKELKKTKEGSGLVKSLSMCF
jgi:hypothetical protein